MFTAQRATELQHQRKQIAKGFGRCFKLRKVSRIIEKVDVDIAVARMAETYRRNARFARNFGDARNEQR